MNAHAIKTRLASAALVLALGGGLAVPVAAQTAFPTPEAAAAALSAALKANDEAALVALVGEKHRSLVVTGDRAHDASVRARLATAMSEFTTVAVRGSDKRVLLVGARAWPMAIPLVRDASGWHFAGELGEDELINRRIGANERYAIHVLRAYVDAQRQYASVDRDGDGVRQYARKLASSPGKRDGLYWVADEAKGEEVSPFGPLIAASDGSPSPRQKGDPYQGYHYRILTAQGKNAAGGAYNYLINGRLIAGFAMVAWPHEYGNTGVTSFIVNHNGKVFEKDLGAQSEAIALKMTTFDPGTGWREVAP